MHFAARISTTLQLLRFRSSRTRVWFTQLIAAVALGFLGISSAHAIQDCGLPQTSVIAFDVPQRLQYIVAGRTGLVHATPVCSAQAVYTSTTPGVCTTDSGPTATVTGVSVGICTIVAGEDGDPKYIAGQATISFPIIQLSQSITISGPPSIVAGRFGLVSTVVTSGLPVTYSSTTPGVCTTDSGPTATVTGVSAGTCTIAANQAGNISYTAAPQATLDISISPVSTTTTTQTPTTTTSVASSTTTTIVSVTTTTTAPTTSSTGAGTTTTAPIATTTTATATTSTTVVSTTTTTQTTSSAPLNLVAGWNLVGNSSNAALDVVTAFGDANKVSTVWKWIASSTKWAFYAPSLVGQALTDYATGKGYDVLTTISGGEGFWVNAKAAFTAQLLAGAAITSTSFQTIASGWNLVSVGETATPKQFCDAQSSGVTTLWAWDSTNSAWYFYAPSLDASGGLGSYITSKGYLDFTASNKTLGPGTGFWVNKP